jgi:hypothetical protein
MGQDVEARQDGREDVSGKVRTVEIRKPKEVRER